MNSNFRFISKINISECFKSYVLSLLKQEYNYKIEKLRKMKEKNK
jgi:hypothetical protein